MKNSQHQLQRIQKRLHALAQKTQKLSRPNRFAMTVQSQLVEQKELWAYVIQDSLGVLEKQSGFVFLTQEDAKTEGAKVFSCLLREAANNILK